MHYYILNSSKANWNHLDDQTWIKPDFDRSLRSLKQRRSHEFYFYTINDVHTCKFRIESKFMRHHNSPLHSIQNWSDQIRLSEYEAMPFIWPSCDTQLTLDWFHLTLVLFLTLVYYNNRLLLLFCFRSSVLVIWGHLLGSFSRAFVITMTLITNWGCI